MTTECTNRELLIYTISRLLAGVRHVAVGMSSPMPAAGAMLLRALNRKHGGEDVQLSILGSIAHNAFTSGAEELFDCAAQGRIDAFFLGGGQIDGKGNVNLVGAGGYPNSKVRWPGSYPALSLSVEFYLHHDRHSLFHKEFGVPIMPEISSGRGRKLACGAS